MTKRFAVIANNKVLNIAIADEPQTEFWVDLTGMDPEPGFTWTYVDGVFTAPAIPDPVPAPPELRVITKAAMMARFTDDEFVRVLVASKTDVMIEAWYAKLTAATTIDLDDQRTKEGINTLVQIGLLDEHRRRAILTMPVQPNERP